MSVDERQPRKRAAFESPARLASPVAYDPDMKRPISTTAGVVLVFLRVIAGFVWLLFLWADRRALTGLSLEVDGAALSGEDTTIVLWALTVVMGAVLVVDAALGYLILKGRNLPRVIVMLFSTLSICTVFSAWWAQGQDIRIDTTLVTLAFDILVLLALSSRSAAAYARRFERR